MLILLLLALLVPHSFPYDTRRLPKTAKPQHYHLNLTVYLDPQDGEKQWTFEGDVRIRLEMTEPHVSNITLHAHPTLKIQHIQLIHADRKEPIPIAWDHEGHWLIIILEDPMNGFSKYYDLKITYAGDMTPDVEDSVGLYKVYSRDGKTVTQVVTQGEPIGTRKVVPCFDEPGFKARFSVAVTKRKAWTALSNASPIRTVCNEEFETVFFDETPPMSAYLLTISVNKFHHISDVTGSGTELRIWADPEIINQTQKALETTKDYLSRFEQLFDIPYQMDKLDSLAVHNKPGAMENWGLITYLSGILTRNGEATIAHELAHQWFGNLVTMDWWPDIWLNEGLASFFQLFIRGDDLLNVELFQVAEVLKFSDRNGLTSVVASNPDPADSISKAHFLNGATYDKGAVMMGFLEDVLGRKCLIEGLKSYLSKFAFSSASTADFLNSLSDSTKSCAIRDWNGGNLDVYEFFYDWLGYSGYPTIDAKYDKKSGILALRQQGFQSSKGTKYWKIPIRISLEGNKQKLIWLTDRLRGILIGKDTKEFILNENGRGYYDVNYDEAHYEEIIARLMASPTHISPNRRLHYFTSGFPLKNPEIGLRLTCYLHKEQHPLVWQAAANIASLLSFRLPEKYRKFGCLLWLNPWPPYEKFLSSMRKDFRSQIPKWSEIPAAECFRELRKNGVDRVLIRKRSSEFEELEFDETWIEGLNASTGRLPKHNMDQLLGNQKKLSDMITRILAKTGWNLVDEVIQWMDSSWDRIQDPEREEMLKRLVENMSSSKHKSALQRFQQNHHISDTFMSQFYQCVDENSKIYESMKETISEWMQDCQKLQMKQK